MGLPATGAALAFCLVLVATAVFFDRRPYRPGKRNYVPLMIVALVASLFLARHLLTLLM